MGDAGTDALDNLEVKLEKQEYWKFTQWFRKMQNNAQRQEENDDHDHLTAVEFDDTGRFLATGDKSGNIVILESDEAKSKNHVHYSFFAEFTSHFADFDFVRSAPIDEKINQIKFGPSSLDALFLLTTNDKQIKLWKVKEKEQYKLVNWNVEPSGPLGYVPTAPSPLETRRGKGILRALKIPKKVVTEKAKLPHLRRTFASDVHNYNIASMSVTADKEAFLSGDNLRINLWDLNVGTHAYNVLDIKPEDMSELSEIISSADCHPSESNLFLYSTSLGNIMTCDLRQRALVDEPCNVYTELPEGDVTMADQALDEEQEHQTFFNEMTQNITAAKFSKSGKYIISRDYMSVKIWDVAMERAPIETIYVHEYLREKMYDLYSNDLLWDPFGMGVSSKGDIVTGTYSNYFHIFDLGRSTDTFVQASQQALKTSDLARSKKKKQTNYAAQQDNTSEQKRKKATFMGGFFKKKGNKGKSEVDSSVKPADEYPHHLPFDDIKFGEKILDCAWHPEKDAVAVAGQNNLYIYAKTRK